MPINGTSGNNTLYGTAGADVINGLAGADTIWGRAGNDYINGGADMDVLYGEDGDDVFEVGGSVGGMNAGYDKYDGGTGFDTIRIIPTSGYVWTAIQILSMANVEAIQNSTSGPGYIYFDGTLDLTNVAVTGIDRIYGNDSRNTFLGNGNNEIVEGGWGTDTLYGNGGNDTLYGDTVGNSSITGADKLYGGAGDDFLDGMYSNDVLDGGAGNNTLVGGQGADQFVFGNVVTSTTITDFASGSDKIKFDLSVADDFSDLTIGTESVNGYATVAVGDITIVLNNVSASALTSSDFLFA